MNQYEFQKILECAEHPVVLLEGTRKLPARDVPRLRDFAKWLAETFSGVMFRSGNAEGSDTAFANGIISIDPKRFQYVLPYAGHRKKCIAEESAQFALSSLTPSSQRALTASGLRASPKYKSLFEKRGVNRRLGAKADYLLRDTLKVTGAMSDGLFPASAALFYVNAEDPEAGGTGHTIRTCRENKIPYEFQFEFLNWMV